MDKKLEVIVNNRYPKQVKTTGESFNKDEMKAIFRAENSSKNDFIEITREDINNVIENFDDNEKELFELHSRLFKIKKEISRLVKDSLSFRPYIILLDNVEVSKEFINELEIAVKESLNEEDKLNLILDIIDNYI